MRDHLRTFWMGRFGRVGFVGDWRVKGEITPVADPIILEVEWRQTYILCRGYLGCRGSFRRRGAKKWRRGRGRHAGPHGDMTTSSAPDGVAALARISVPPAKASRSSTRLLPGGKFPLVEQDQYLGSGAVGQLGDRRTRSVLFRGEGAGGGRGLGACGDGTCRHPRWSWSCAGFSQDG